MILYHFISVNIFAIVFVYINFLNIRNIISDDIVMLLS